MINNYPLVSIVTITRNRSTLISKAVESVLNQTYKNIEYIIVDGASEDNTVDVIESFHDNRIKLIKLHENLPIPETINIGVQKSSGKYITFLDDDDEYLPRKIEKQLELIEKLSDEYGFVYCWMDYFDSNSKKKIGEHRPSLRGFVPEKVIEEPIVSGTPTLFFRKDSFLKLGGWKDNIGIISDWELAARACQIYKIDFVPQVLVKVNVNHEAIRMSDNNYYTGILSRNIKFHTHFLNEFENMFEKYPQKKNKHLYAIARSVFIQGNWKQGWHYYKALLSNSITLKYILLPPYCFLLRIFQNGKKFKQS